MSPVMGQQGTTCVTCGGTAACATHVTCDRTVVCHMSPVVGQQGAREPQVCFHFKNSAYFWQQGWNKGAHIVRLAGVFRFVCPMRLDADSSADDN